MGLYRHQVRTICWSVASLVAGLITGAWIATNYAPPTVPPVQPFLPPVEVVTSVATVEKATSTTTSNVGQAKGETPCVYEHQTTSPSSLIRRSTGVPVVDAGSEAALKQYISPTIYGDRSKVKMGSPATLRDEYKVRHKVLFGVMTQQNYLPTRAKTLYDTWGSEMPDQLVLYVGEDCLIPKELAHLPFVKLQGVSDRVYPPLKKAFVAMRHMCENYLDKYHWFVRGDDDMYANGAKLQDLLMSFDHNEIVVLGRPGVGADTDMPRLQLLSHEAYCMGGPGMIFSRGAMEAIRPYLSACYNAIVLHDNKTGLKWHDDDVEIGRCFSRFLDVQCSTSKQAMDVFFYDYFNKATKVNTLWSLPEFKKAITVHPIKQPDNMRSLHHFYKRLDFEESYKWSMQLASKVNQLCTSLPPSLHPPSYSTNCQLTIQSNLVEHTSLLYGPGDLLEGLLHYKPQSEMPYFYNRKERFDVSTWTLVSPSTVYEVGGDGSAHSIFPGLNTEMRRIISVVTQGMNGTLKLKEYVSGYTRYSPIGREYILNLLFSDPNSPLTQHHRRFHLLRPFSADVLGVEENYFGPHPSVTVVLPLVGGGDRVGDFLAHFKAAILEATERITLRIVAANNGLEEAARQGIAQHLGNPSNVFVRRVEGADRGGAIEAAVKELEDGKDDLVFITDVSTRIQPWFFHTCRSNTVAGKRAYFPIAFWTNELRTPPSYSSWAGDWGHTSFLQACLYKSDYTKLGGASSSLVTLMEKLVEHGMEAMQAPDTGLIHLLPQRTCADIHRKRQRKCRAYKSLWSNERPDLVDYLVELEDAKGMPLSYS
ncbi:hypothetical protein EMCRGX_G014073 [Ephydatia muelleri]|eukprot:Em0004g1740a